MYKFLAFLAAIAFVACNNAENNNKEINPSPEQQLIGEGNNLS